MTATALSRAALIDSANPGGGWGYYAGKASRLEPTCWALLALGADPSAAFDAEVHWRFVAQCQRESGLLVEDADLPPNLAFNGLAAIALQHQSRPALGETLHTLLRALVGHAGAQARQSPNLRQDNSLRGWPWIDGTFSWVEPTCWGLLALKRARAAGREPTGAAVRVEEAERMLIDRCCRIGGWNYGNSNVFGKDLDPYVPTTALALLALHDRPHDPAVVRSLKYLEGHWQSEVSTVGLGLTSICFRRYAREFGRVNEALTARRPIAEALGNLHALAIALYASSADSHDTAFTF